MALRATPFVTVAAPRSRSMRQRLALALIVLAGGAQAAQVPINGPIGSRFFGASVTTLPNGNVVVTDPLFDPDGLGRSFGGAFLYRPDGTLISGLTGSTPGDLVAYDGVIVLSNGDYVVKSPFWDNGSVTDAGAITHASGVTGVSGVVTPGNSLVGGSADDQVGNGGVTALPNGKYFVVSSFWNNGVIVDAGAVTVCAADGTTTGVVAPVISLVGSTANDRLGSFGSTILGNGNVVVVSADWDNGAVVDAGAVTFIAVNSGISGAVSAANSLVGSSTLDQVGNYGVTPLTNGNFVVVSANWDNGAIADTGAVTFGSGVSGISGQVSPVNSLVGGSAGDQVGVQGVTALTNGNYVVTSTRWNNLASNDVGAVTFGSGSVGASGLVSPANSLVGSSAGDQVGSEGVIALTNGNYVVRSAQWDDAMIVDVGAVTFGNGSSGISGAVASGNSLVGSSVGDLVGGYGVTPLTNGNYVVRSSQWDNGPTPNVGAVTFGSGTGGINGVVAAGNSLIGTSEDDLTGNAGVAALANGNYVVLSSAWNNGTSTDAGAATFGSGSSGVTGEISAANSLVGSGTNDQVGGSGVTVLGNGNYLVKSIDWDNATSVDAGAVTFGSGTSGISGIVTPANSLVGSTAGDTIGQYGVAVLVNDNYVVLSPDWDNGAASNVGAATFGSGSSGISGVVTSANSLVGSTAGDLVGRRGVTPLSTGNYVVQCPECDNGAAVDAGAVIFGSGSSGISGIVAPANSLVGSSTGDRVGDELYAQPNGAYVVKSEQWDDGATIDAGAVTLGPADGSATGAITDDNSAIGLVQDGGPTHRFSYDPVRNQLAVGQRPSTRVVLHRTGIATAVSIVGEAPDPSVGGEPVTFTATVSASPNAPNNGQVTFAASSGESCVDATPTPTSATSAEFSCSVVFNANGVSTVTAEYTGSLSHAYGRSAAQTHTTIIDAAFASGFESP